jgi:hypothetical protein
MEIALIFLGLGITIVMIVILLAWVSQDMKVNHPNKWYDNKAAFDVAEENRKEWEKNN